MQKDIIVSVADRARFTQKDTKIILDAFVEVMQEICRDMKVGEKMTLGNFVTFKAIQRAEKTMINPRDGVRYEIRPEKRIKVRATDGFVKKMWGDNSNTGEEDDLDV